MAIRIVLFNSILLQQVSIIIRGTDEEKAGIAYIQCIKTFSFMPIHSRLKFHTPGSGKN